MTSCSYVTSKAGMIEIIVQQSQPAQSWSEYFAKSENDEKLAPASSAPPPDYSELLVRPWCCLHRPQWLHSARAQVWVPAVQVCRLHRPQLGQLHNTGGLLCPGGWWMWGGQIHMCQDLSSPLSWRILPALLLSSLLLLPVLLPWNPRPDLMLWWMVLPYRVLLTVA